MKASGCARLYVTVRPQGNIFDSNIYLQVSNIPKTAAVDSQLTVGGASGETAVFPIPKGSLVGLHVVGLHYNRMFSLPHERRVG